MSILRCFSVWVIVSVSVYVCSWVGVCWKIFGRVPVTQLGCEEGRGSREWCKMKMYSRRTQRNNASQVHWTQLTAKTQWHVMSQKTRVWLKKAPNNCSLQHICKCPISSWHEDKCLRHIKPAVARPATFFSHLSTSKWNCVQTISHPIKANHSSCWRW